MTTEAVLLKSAVDADLDCWGKMVEGMQEQARQLVPGVLVGKEVKSRLCLSCSVERHGRALVVFPDEHYHLSLDVIGV